MLTPPRNLPAWIEPYIGAPYSDGGEVERPGTFNCWTLYAHIRLHVFGKKLVDYDGPVWAGMRGVKEMAAAADAFARQFTEIDEASAAPGDAILMRFAGAPIHVGCVVAPGWMLHINKTIDAVVESWRHPLYVNRIEGFYRT